MYEVKNKGKDQVLHRTFDRQSGAADASVGGVALGPGAGK